MTPTRQVSPMPTITRDSINTMNAANAKPKTILLTGANGQTGYELARALQRVGTVVAMDRRGLDLTDFDQIRRVVRDLAPALIVNAAACTAVDAAESDSSHAMLLNADAPGVLAQEAKRLGALLVHYSTDYVFDGTKHGPYDESDATNPLNVYGKSKLAGEQAIAASDCAHLILRTSWVYGTRGENFLRTMLRLGAERDEISVVNDQIGAPTWSRTIATMTSSVLSQLLANEHDRWMHDSGVYHLTAGGATSWCGFAEAIFRHLKYATYATQLKQPGIKAVATASYPTPAARPLNSRLSNEKLQKTFGVKAPDWEDALQRCVSELR
jgi:dTDP-4-dehydrorhamnose reductase